MGCVLVGVAGVRKAGRAQCVTREPATLAVQSMAPAKMASVNVARAGTESTAPLRVALVCATVMEGVLWTKTVGTVSVNLDGEELGVMLPWKPCAQIIRTMKEPYCRGSPDPNDIIGQSQQPPPQQAAKSFYDRISFLVGPDSSHVIPGENPFNKSLVSIIRGQVLTADGTPLIGVNVSFVHYPEHGYTIARQDGMFDLLANGGASLTLSFERAPFLTQYRTVWIPWNVFYVMDTLVMKKEENDIPSCDLSGFVRPSPLIVSSPLSTFFRSSPEESPIIPETQVLQEETAIPGTDLKLFYLSSRAAGYKPILKVTMTQTNIPFNLMKVHLMVAVVGRLFQKWFPASPNLSYTFIWDKTDAYNQKVYGLSEAVVSVGFEYESCLDLILWEKRTAILQGYELDASNMGGWTPDKHHVLDVQNGILYKGNGENQFISQQPPVISTIMGNGRRRSISCPSCNGQADGNKLLAPVSLACGIDGSLYVGDFNYVRRIFPSGNVTSVMELSTNPTHRYYLATDPVTGQLYVSDTNSRRIYCTKMLTGAKDLLQNSEVVAGTGEQCLPFDEARCGDGGKAIEALLMGPKGIAVDKNGFIYFVDGTMIRKVDQNGIISTLLGSNDLTSARPLTCDTSMHISQVRLEWPTDLAINPMDNSIYVLDNNVVLQITENRQVRIAAGRPMHCQVPGIEYAMGKRAVQTTLESASAIAVSYSGVVYIAETDEKKINRIRQSISGVQQEVVRQARAFLSFGKMPEIQISRRKSSGEKSWLWFAAVKSLIGKGVMLAVNQGRVVTNVLNIANEDCIKVAAVLNNAFYLENLHFTVEGKDTHYFIKTSSSEIDLGTLRLTSGRKALENGINVTVSQSTTVVNGRTRRFADVEMQYGALVLHVRYGMTLDEEEARILEQARQRALSSAWAREQQRVRDGEEGARLWTEGEKRQLLSAGKVQGYDGYYVLSVEQYPELADSANNIQFLRQSEIGKR
ncbi:Teneurin-3 [Acipenser ruthenus]|uniref:Teneurin-3 n=1 Tax=Acipenser ruthenus TaxID=7906 RepID=A0A444UGH6_ACIRT|nr:Teneurin-3 [Acipenser ruthenus]